MTERPPQAAPRSSITPARKAEPKKAEAHPAPMIENLAPLAEGGCDPNHPGDQGQDPLPDADDYQRNRDREAWKAIEAAAKDKPSSPATQAPQK